MDEDKVCRGGGRWRLRATRVTGTIVRSLLKGRARGTPRGINRTPYSFLCASLYIIRSSASGAPLPIFSRHLYAVSLANPCRKEDHQSWLMIAETAKFLVCRVIMGLPYHTFSTDTYVLQASTTVNPITAGIIYAPSVPVVTWDDKKLSVLYIIVLLRMFGAISNMNQCYLLISYPLTRGAISLCRTYHPFLIYNDAPRCCSVWKESILPSIEYGLSQKERKSDRLMERSNKMSFFDVDRRSSPPFFALYEWRHL